MTSEPDAEFQPRETRSNTKIAVYVPPRIDADAFQADIPQLQDALPPPTYAGESVSRIAPMNKTLLETDWYEGMHCISRPDDVMVKERGYCLI